MYTAKTRGRNQVVTADSSAVIAEERSARGASELRERAASAALSS
jgi:hypothetical protein